MGYKGTKTCGRPHPQRQGVKCWGNDCSLDEQHWAYVSAPHNTTTKVTWRLYEEPVVQVAEDKKAAPIKEEAKS